MKKQQHIFDNPQNVKLLIRAIFAASIVAMVAGFFVHREVNHPWEAMFGFYGLFGYIAFVVLVLLAREMRKLLMRKEDYYDD